MACLTKVGGMARIYLSDRKFIRKNKVLMVGKALTTTNFPKVFESVASKSLFKGFDQDPETWADRCALPVGCLRSLGNDR